MLVRAKIKGMTRLLWLVLAVTLLVVGCGPAGSGGGAGAGSGRLVVVSTVGFLGDAVAEIGGDAVESVVLMGPGVDPHLYKPTARDAERLQAAGFVATVGLHLEGRMGETLEKLRDQGKPVWSAGDVLPPQTLIQTAEGKFDPHIWHDPTLWALAVEALGTSLAEAVPEAERAGVQERTRAYVAQIVALDEETKKALTFDAGRPRILVTAHDAFEYFGRRYDVQVEGIQGTSTVSEASAQEIRRLADLIASRGVRTIFVETSVPRATIEALQSAVRSRGATIAIGKPLFSDAMGEPGTPEGSYVGMFRSNVAAIRDGLK